MVWDLFLRVKNARFFTHEMFFFVASESVSSLLLGLLKYFVFASFTQCNVYPRWRMLILLNFLYHIHELWMLICQCQRLGLRASWVYHPAIFICRGYNLSFFVHQVFTLYISGIQALVIRLEKNVCSYVSSLIARCII